MSKTGRMLENKMQQNIGRSSSRIGLLAGLLLVVCAMVSAAHWPALSARALSFDDQQYLTDNLLVQNPSWTSVRRFLSEVLEPSTVRGYYQPLTMISLMADYALGGREDNLRPFHRTSLALHVSNTALVIVLLYLLFGRAWIAAVVGLIFGVHPMTVEPIPWVGERKTLLAAFFALWCLILYVRFSRKSDWKLYAGSLVMYVLALMSKPTSVPLPALMLLMDYWPLRRLNRRAILEKLPFFAVGGIAAIITYISQGRTAGVGLPYQYGPARIPLVICYNIIFYLYKIVWPINLSSHYAYPEPFGFSEPMVLAGVIGTCILIPLLVVSLRWTPAVLTGWLFFFVAIFPTMGVIGFTNVIASDKFAYLPSVGLLMVLASFLCWFCNTGKLATRRKVVVMVVLLLAGAEAVATRRYLVHWRDTVSLCEYILTLTPDAVPVRCHLGFVLESQGKLNEAIGHYRRALQIMPDYAKAHNNLGTALSAQGKLDEAISHYRQALQVEPDYADAHYNLGLALQSQGKLNEAIGHYRRALKIKPDYAKAHNNLGTALSAQGKFDEAISHFRQVLEVKPDLYEVRNNLGNALSAQGKFSEAISHYRQVLQLQPDNAKAHNNLGIALQALGKLDEAISHYRQALQVRPKYASAHYNLSLSLQSQGKLDEAITHYRQILQTRPNHVRAHHNLGLALQSQGKLDEAISHYRRALQARPDYAPAHYNLGLTLQSQGKLDEAIGHFRQAVRIRPNFAIARYNLGNALRSQGKLNEAIEHYRHALQVRPNHANAHHNLGIALLTQGKLDEASSHFRQASRIKPNFANAHNNLAWILATHPDPNIRDANQAIELAERAARLTKYQDISILDTLATAYAAAGQFDRAVTTAQTALALASAAQNEELANHIRKQLELYKQAKPVRNSTNGKHPGKEKISNGAKL